MTERAASKDRKPHAVAFLLMLLTGWIGIADAREWKDASGKYRVQAELVAVRGSKVILEKESGEIISVPLERLCEEDRNFLDEAKQNASGQPAAAMTDRAAGENDFQSLSKFELADQVAELLRGACYRCHGEDGTSEGGFNFVNDLPKLAKSFAKPGEASLLLERITADDDSMMPPVDEEPRLSDRDIALIQHWVQSGSPSRPRKQNREFITNETVHLTVSKHLKTVSERNQRFMRYFSLVNLYNAGVSDDELQTYRNAFGKLLNSLSWNRELVLPSPVNESQTLYGIDIRDLNWQSHVWESLETANPYHIPLDTLTAKDCYVRTLTAMPVVRIDWFVFAASRPPLYHDVLGLPETDHELEDLLHVHVDSNIEQEKAIRCGFNRSGVSQNNRLIEWHPSSYGSYWKSYDFGGNVGRQNLFQHPMGPSPSRQSFQHDGGEMIFTLPNGLQAYLLVDGEGKRIDQGPVAIVSDPKRPDRMVTNGVSCMSCHYTGVIPKRDEVGAAIRANPKAFAGAEDILALYREPKDLDRVFDRDGKRFADALEKLGIRSLSRGGESVSAMAAQFEKDIDLIHVAAEFGLDEQGFRERLETSGRVARAYSPLLLPGGVIKRDMLKSTFVEACIDFKLVSQAAAIELNRRHPIKLPPEEMTPELELLASAARMLGSAMVEPPAAGNAGTRKPAPAPSSMNPSSMRSSRTPSSSIPGGISPSRMSPNRGMPPSTWPGPDSIQERIDSMRSLTSPRMMPSTRSRSAVPRSGATPTMPAPSLPLPSSVPVSPRTPSMRSKPAEVVPNPNDVVQFGDISWGFGGLCFAADGNRIVGGHKSDGVSVFDVAGKSVLSITKLGEEYRRLGLCQFSQDGRLLLLSSDRGLVVCCQLDGNNRPKPISQFAGHSRGLSCMDLSKDGRIAATGDSDKRVRCWETKSGHQFGDVLTFERAPQAVRISPDGNRLWATDGKTVITYDLQQKEILDQRVLSGAGIGQASAISFDGALLASGDSYAVKLWDIRTGRPLPSMEAGEIQWSMQFMPNSKVLVSGGRNKLSFWDTDRQQRVAAEIFDDAGYIKVFAISPDGNLVAAHTRRNVVVRKIEVTK